MLDLFEAEKLGRREAALKLAIQYADREQIVSLCVALDTQELEGSAEEADSLDRFTVAALNELPRELGLADYALQWYLRHQEHRRIHSLLAFLDQTGGRGDVREPNRKRPLNFSSTELEAEMDVSQPDLALSDSPEPAEASLDGFLDREETADISWLYLLSKADYQAVCERTLKMAQSERTFVGRKKTLLSLAKLAKIAQLGASNPTEVLGNVLRPNRCGEDDHSLYGLKKIDAQLFACDAQLRLPETLLERETGRAECVARQPVLQTARLVELFLQRGVHLCSASASSVSSFGDRDHPVPEGLRNGLAELIVALRLCCEQLPGEVKHRSLLRIWAHIIGVDNWAQFDVTMLDFCQSTIFYRLGLALNEAGEEPVNFLPRLRELLDCDELRPYNNSVQFCRHLKCAYELIVH